MSNNAAVTPDGHEIGRAQALQARAAGLLPHVDMNPILIKPETNQHAQVIVMGRPHGTYTAAGYESVKDQLWGTVTEALGRLRASHDVVLIEGAGSPAEINLRDRDIANMRVAEHAGAGVVIVGDIDRGGVFAHLYGTVALLPPNERSRVKGLVVNRFRGDERLLGSACADIERLTEIPVIGVVPWIHNHGIPEEDAVALERRVARRVSGNPLDVAIVRFPHISNFDDFDSLQEERDVNARYVSDAAQLGSPDLVVLPGTKSTIGDLRWLRAVGLDRGVQVARASGAAIIGICGGYQMLGSSIDDSSGVEGISAVEPGLAMLDMDTRFEGSKVTRPVTASCDIGKGMLEGLAGSELSGYEIHVGKSDDRGAIAISLRDDATPLGSIDEERWTFGCYVHGLFANDQFRRGLLENVARRRGRDYNPSIVETLDAKLDRVADSVESSLDMSAVYRILNLVQAAGSTQMV